MSSTLQSALEPIYQNNYISLIGCVIVGYDYILTFSREIDYVWRRDWSWVSTVFILVRYPGLCWAMLGGLIGSTFVPGSVNVSSILFLVSCWTFPVFICAGDLVMILRVHTMWNRSRTILYVLLFIYVVQIIVSVVLPAIYNSSTTYFTASTVQILDLSFCVGTFSASVPTLLGLYAAVPRFALSILLLILAVTRTLKQLVEMYNATKQWQPNRYINQFAKDGTYYFIMNTLYNVVTVIGSVAPSTANSAIIIDVLGMLAVSLLCSAMPRFIISVRELYDRDLRRHWQGIDTGFGVLSQNYNEMGLTSGIAFVDVGQEESQTVQGEGDDLRAVQLEEVGAGSHQV